MPAGNKELGCRGMYYVAETKEEAFAKTHDVIINHRIGTRLHDYTQNSNPRAYRGPRVERR